MTALKDELGDLLFQVVFHARMAEEAGLFAFDDVAAAIADKMVRRHPHVFGNAEIATAAAQNEAWEEHKAAERQARRVRRERRKASLDGVALALPALLRAAKIQRRAARIGFDWPDAGPVMEKVLEEIAELRTEIERDAERAALEDELGDILFAVANLARKLDIDPEDSSAPGDGKVRAPLSPRRVARRRASDRRRSRRARCPVAAGEARRVRELK